MAEHDARAGDTGAADDVAEAAADGAAVEGEAVAADDGDDGDDDGKYPPSVPR
ncbi:MAG: hypothetical protein LBP58_00985 [Azoarcus sp.]|nr:hypothetical protein [Azoarcus sp.]